MSIITDKSAKSDSGFPAATSLVGVYGEQLFRILDSACSGFVLLDAQQRAQRWSEGYLQLFPWLAAELRVGTSIQAALQAASASDLHQQVAAAHASVISRQLSSAEVLLPSGGKVLLTSSAISANYSLLTCKQIPAAGGDSDHLAFFDELTQLPNRRLLLDRLSQAMIQSERTGWRGALLTIDMHISHGLRAAGEQLAASPESRSLSDGLQQEIARRLLGCLRGSDSVARVDDEHFVIMISDLSPDADLASLLVERLAERLQESLNAPYSTHGKHLKLQANIGATFFGPHSRSATELLLEAEAAMYRLREENRRGLHFFRSDSLTTLSDRQRLEVELREALRLNQFEMHYQPQYSSQGQATGVEALLRWRHPQRGLVPPSIFLSVAEESQLIVPLGLWSLRATCEQMAQWKNDALLGQLPISINISARQLQEADFADRLEALLSQTGVDPGKLLLEVSCTALHPLPPDILKMLTQLNAMGVRLSLDDFGHQSCEPEVLRQIPFIQVKLTQKLVQRLGPNNASEAATQAAIELARRSQLTLVATGVETLEQRALLGQHGCQHFMGYLFSAPVAPPQLKPLLHLPQIGQPKATA